MSLTAPRDPLVAHDWDSVIAQPETAIVGLAAAMWPCAGETASAVSSLGHATSTTTSARIPVAHLDRDRVIPPVRAQRTLHRGLLRPRVPGSVRRRRAWFAARLTAVQEEADLSQS